MAENTDPWADASVILAHIQDAIIGESVDGTVEIWNAGAERLFGYAASEAIGRPMVILDPAASAPDIASVRRLFLRGLPVPVRERVYRSKDGRMMEASVALSPVVGEGGQLIGISHVIRRLSSMPDGRASTSDGGNDDLDGEALHRLRLDALGHMATALAHELTQPLTAMVAYMSAARQLLDGRAAQEERTLATAIDRAMEQAVRASRTVKSIRAFACSEDGRRSVSVRSTIMEAADLILATAHPTGVAVEFQLDQDALAAIEPSHVQQVLINLTRNAGEGMRSLDRPLLHISTAVDQDEIIVSVTDTGPGVSTEIADRIFLRFATTKPGGMGAGLSICRAILRAHGGDIWLDRSAPTGATFRFRLPILSERGSTMP